MKQIVKYKYVCSLFQMFVFCTSCGGGNQESFKDKINPIAAGSEARDKANFSKSDEKYDTKYEYTDSSGKRLVILNSLPKGGPYTDPEGKEYFQLIFWTRLINETDNPLKLKIDFPLDSYGIPGLPDKYYKILVPPDTMTVDKEPFPDYGMTGLKHFLDNNIHVPSSLKRTVNPKESGGFYVVVLVDKGIGGPFRTELSINGQNLVYRISRYAGKAQQPVSKNKIHFGSINLKNLMLQKK